MFIGTMHGYCLDLLQRLVPETFKFSRADRHHGPDAWLTATAGRSGLTTCPTISPKVPTLRRFVHSQLYLQVMSVLREDDVDRTSFQRVSRGLERRIPRAFSTTRP